VTYGTAFTTANSVLGDYDLSIHCYTTEDQTLQGEVSYTRIKTPSGFTVFPDFDCALITYLTVPFGGAYVAGGTSLGQHGVDISPAGLVKAVTFDTVYSAVTDYNVAYVRGFLTSDSTVAVAQIIVEKLTTGLNLTPVGVDGLSVTMEWGVLPKTQ
jgi:hypothetical protein